MTQQTINKLKDPVCGEEVTAQSPYYSYFGNGKYYFCSAEHKEEFDKQPEEFAAEDTEPASPCD